MADDKVKALLNIPKKHTLRHYMRLVGKLYGENEDLLETYIEEQVVANEHDLDGAIKCFKETTDRMVTKESIEQQKSKERVERWLKPKK